MIRAEPTYSSSLLLGTSTASVFCGKYPSRSIHSPTNAVIILAQSSTVGISKWAPSSFIVCHTGGNGVGIMCKTSTPRAMNGIWSSWTPHALLNRFAAFSVSGRKGWSGLDWRMPRERSRISIPARLWYAQCVVLKYEGTLGFSVPRRSRRRKRFIELMGE
jgi:hypothetical protein